MSIQELSQKFKGFLQDTEVLLTILIILVASVSFYLGRVSVAENHGFLPQTPQNAQIITGYTAEAPAVPVSTSTVAEIGKVDESPSKNVYVASKSGTKYHLPWCPGAKQIKEENEVWFASKEEAEQAGYTPAANCKGI